MIINESWGSSRNVRGSRLLVCLLLAGMTSGAGAQSTTTGYLPMNGSIMPFDTLSAPNETISISADTQMNYHAVVSTINVSWGSISDTDNYKLEKRNPVTHVWEEIYDGTSTLRIYDDLTVGRHYYRVIACGGGLCGDPSNTASANVELNYDYDQDGIIDRLDLCEDSAENADDLTVHGCAETDDDSDFDGYTDDLDWCAGTDPNATDIDDRGCTPDQVDSDEDGIPDYQDSYPHQHDSACLP